MKNIIRIMILAGLLIGVTSCELDQLENPNEVSVSQSNPDFILNNIQLNFAFFFVNMSQYGMDNTRMTAMFGNTYPNAYQGVSFDAPWTTAYANILADANLIASLAAKNDKLDYHAGMANFFKAYTLMMLVDYFGDIPFTEAFDNSNFNPVTDDDAAVYAKALETLDAALANFGAVDVATDLPGNDLYYTLDQKDFAPAVKNWITAAKTLKLRALLQTRLVNAAASTAGINALIAGGDLIDTNAEAFAFRASSSSITSPDTRHPWFSANYVTGASQYMSNSYINALFVGKGGTRDPRIRHYFYRQTLAIPTDVNVLDCINQSKPAHYGAGDIFCFVGQGYWGRDHLDDDGTPPDNLVRTIYGHYPVGGQWDNSEGVRGTVDSGAKGAGIIPMLLPSYTLFMEAEAALVLGTTGDPKLLLKAAVTNSIDFVRNFNTTTIPFLINGVANPRVPTALTVTNYINAVMNNYDISTDKLDIIISEYWIALWGNGVDMYNTYRRTGKPSNLQPTLTVTPGEFYRSFTYPSVYITRNSKAKPKASPAVQVFWDTNPAGFIK
jgi:hypothetical protein